MNNANKKCWFSLEERKKNLIEMLVSEFGDKVEVKSFDWTFNRFYERKWC